MPRPRSSGLNVVRKRRGDGSVLEYFYDRATRRFLGHDREAAAARVAEMTERSPARLPDGSLAALITEYLGTPEYARLKPRTRALYRHYLDQMRVSWGDLAFRSITGEHIHEVRDGLQATPSKANMILALFRILFGLAKRKGYVTENPAEKPGRLPIAKRIEVWSHEGEAAFLAAAPNSLRLAFILLLYTVQRPSDVLDMGPHRISERDGRLYIALRQGKTETLLDVPVHVRLEAPLRDRLAACEAERAVRAAARERPRPQFLVPSPTGLRWTIRNFSRSWDATVRRTNLRLARQMFGGGLTKVEVRAELDEQHRQRRDLRRTGIVRLAEAGATVPQIAALSGHSIDYCQRILDTYLPRRTEVALGGIETWERSADMKLAVVRLASERRRKA